jgi:hypothetical protein
VLAPKKVEDRQGAGGTRSHRKNGRKPFVVKILTSNHFVIKILQPLFAKPAPSKAFQREGGGGTPLNHDFSKMKEAENRPPKLVSQNFFIGFAQG